MKINTPYENIREAFETGRKDKEKYILELIDEGCGFITPREKGVLTNLRINNCSSGRLCWRCKYLKAKILKNNG